MAVTQTPEGLVFSELLLSPVSPHSLSGVLCFPLEPAQGGTCGGFSPALALLLGQARPSG